MTNLKML